jgi:transposase
VDGGTLAKEKPPIVGMIQRGGQVFIQMLKNVQQANIQPVIQSTIAPGTLIYTDRYAIYDRLASWGYTRKSVCMVPGNPLVSYFKTL